MTGASLVRFRAVDPASGVARRCVQAYAAELDRRVDGGHGSWEAIAPTLDQHRPPHGVFLVATLRGEAIGCGGLRIVPRETGGHDVEIKRMWVAESARGLGLGRRLLAELERHAAELGFAAVRLETNGGLIEAIALYRSAGYVEVAPFNTEPYAHHWFEKPLEPTP